MTSSLDVVETQPATAPSVRGTPFVVCGGLLGCASFIIVEMVALKTSGTIDPNWGAVVAAWFLGGVVGPVTGGALAAQCLDHQPAVAETVAPLLYALTALAVPFLLYIALAMVVISALSGMTF